MKQWMKKAAAVLLGGVLAAGLLSGCSRTIIEHQFHTEYVGGGAGGSGTGGTGGTTVVNYSETLKKLDELLAEHSFMLQVVYPERGTMFPVEAGVTLDDNTKSIDLTTWMSDPTSKLYISKKVAGSNDEIDAYSYPEYIKDWSEHLDMIYEAFSKLTEEDWKDLRTAIVTADPYKSTIIYIHTYLVSGNIYVVQPPYYVRTIVTCSLIDNVQ